MSSNNDSDSIIKNALLATMIGFGSSTGLVNVRNDFSTKYTLEYVLDPKNTAYDNHVATLPFYSGRVSDILDTDLGGTGNLIKVYKPQLLLPQTNFITVHNATRIFPLRTGVFHVFDFEKHNHVLSRNSGILLPNNRLESIIPIIQPNNQRVINGLISSCAEEVRRTNSLTPVQREALYQAMQDYRHVILDGVEDEFRLLRYEIDILRRELNETRRVLAQIPKEHVFDIRKAIASTPQRYLESMVDEIINGAGKTFIKSIALSVL